MITYARDPFNLTGGDVEGASFQAWSDRDAHGGLDGPGAWMDANVEAGGLYQPAIGGSNNPIPTLIRSPISGADSDDPLAYAARFNSTAGGAGTLTIYGWADPNSSSGTQTVSLINGFQVRINPEPASLALCACGLLGVLFRRVR